MFFAELEDLEAVGVIGECDTTDKDIVRLYVSSVGQYDEWSIGIYLGHSLLALRPGVTNPVMSRNDVSDVTAELVADPFMIEVDNLWFMFFEVMNWKTKKGEIGLATSPDGQQWHYQQIVLVEPFHLSYPYVFHKDGEYYMIPEAHQSKSVRLYRAVDFPLHWSFAATLLEGPYFVDTTVFHAKGDWWLFTETSPRRRHDTLRLFHADSLFGPWQEHPKSPVVVDNPVAARPAGRVVIEGNEIIRFAQNCSAVYGADVRAFAVSQLSTSRYKEKQIGENPILIPAGSGWNSHGMHHIDAHKCKDGTWLACVDGWTKNE